LFFLACSVGAFVAGQYWAALFFWVFILMGVYMIVVGGHYTISDDNITHRNMLGTYRIAWRDVKRVEVGAQDGSIVLHGDNKRFVLAPPAMWSGKQKPDAFTFFTNKIKRSGITPYPSSTAAYKMHKNVKVSSH
jgi:hypothetical protein